MPVCPSIKLGMFQGFFLWLKLLKFKWYDIIGHAFLEYMICTKRGQVTHSSDGPRTQHYANNKCLAFKFSICIHYPTHVWTVCCWVYFDIFDGSVVMTIKMFSNECVMGFFIWPAVIEPMVVVLWLRLLSVPLWPLCLFCAHVQALLGIVCFSLSATRKVALHSLRPTQSFCTSLSRWADTNPVLFCSLS